MVEIAAAVSHETRLLIVDEPTASLTPTEVGRLFQLLRSLRDRGTGVLFIGHRLEEVFEISDRITVLRDGSVVETREASAWNEPDLIEAMVGRKTDGTFQRTSIVFQANAVTAEEEVMRVEGLSRSGVFQDISFSVRPGEVIGMAGLVGSGRSEIARVAFGIDVADAGSVTVAGHKLPSGRPDAAITHGLAYVPEDRKSEGLAAQLPIYENVALLMRTALGGLGWLRGGTEVAVAEDFVRRLDIRAVGVRQKVGELSGGNQQKVLLAKWLVTNPKVLILDEPTRGVDVGAKEAIHRLIDGLAHEGLGIVVISSDMPEVLALSDRIVVIREGRIAGELARGCSAEKVLQLAVLSTVPAGHDRGAV
jgi:rhamnose transport system ATP-binding protein